MAQPITPNLEDQVICDRGFLTLAFDNSMSSYKAADASLVRPGYFISPVPAISGEHSPIRHLWTRPMRQQLGMDTSLEWKIVVGQRRFTSGHRTVGEEKDRNDHGGTR